MAGTSASLAETERQVEAHLRGTSGALRPKTRNPERFSIRCSRTKSAMPRLR